MIQTNELICDLYNGRLFELAFIYKKFVINDIIVNKNNIIIDFSLKNWSVFDTKNYFNEILSKYLSNNYFTIKINVTLNSFMNNTKT